MGTNDAGLNGGGADLAAAVVGISGEWRRAVCGDGFEPGAGIEVVSDDAAIGADH